MKCLRPSRFPASSFLLAIFCSIAPARIAAQDQPVQSPAPQSQLQANQAPQSGAQQNQAAPESAPREFWSWLKEGKIAFNARYRFEAFERDGAPFTGTAYAPTLRLMLGY